MPLLAVVIVSLPLESTLPRWRLLLRTLPRPKWPSFSRICFREKSRALICHWCIRCPYLTNSSLNRHAHPFSPLQVLWWRFTYPHWLVTKSVFRPAFTLKPYPVFRRRQLPYHLVQQCLHCSTNRPGTPPCRWVVPRLFVQLISVLHSRHNYHSIS